MLIPHGVQLATKGFLGVTIGTTSKGYLIRVEEVTPTPTERTTGPGGRGFREDKKKEDRLIKVTVYAYGKKWETEHAVAENVKVGIEDIEVVEKGEGIIEVAIKNLKKGSK